MTICIKFKLQCPGTNFFWEGSLLTSAFLDYLWMLGAMTGLNSCDPSEWKDTICNRVWLAGEGLTGSSKDSFLPRISRCDLVYRQDFADVIKIT